LEKGVAVADSNIGSAWRNERLTVDERIARGKNARNESPRRAHGRWKSSLVRPDPVSLLEEQATTRVPELVPIRHGRMLASPFAFYRGGALVMASDLANTANSGITVQLCGDAHLSNFGLFGTPERQLVFDLNDFDETLPGPWEWDVKRLAASLEIAGRDRGFAADDCRAMVLAGVAGYRNQMRIAAEMNTLDVWYEHVEAGQLLDAVANQITNKGISKREGRIAQRDIAKARTRTSVEVMAKRTTDVDGRLRITPDPPLIVPIEDVYGVDRAFGDQVIAELLAQYVGALSHDRHPLEQFRYVHAARKVVGVGSVGTRCFLLLLVGRDDNDPLFIQVKEAEASVLERFLGKSRYGNHGERVVVGQRALQATSDIFLGWQHVTGVDGVERDFYIRQFHDWKGSIEVESMQASGAALYGQLCGIVLARAHARWGDRIAIAAYLGKNDVFDNAIADFSAAYADQNERDFEALQRAVKDGRVAAEFDV
jgi:uncharacterized protein (DUF2252 family)